MTGPKWTAQEAERLKAEGTGHVQSLFPSKEMYNVYFPTWAIGLLLLHFQRSPLVGRLVLLLDDLALIELVLPGNIVHDILKQKMAS